MSDRDRLANDASAIARKLAPVATSGTEGRVNRRLIGGLAEEVAAAVARADEAGHDGEEDDPEDEGQVDDLVGVTGRFAETYHFSGTLMPRRPEGRKTSTRMRIANT